jgi:hypothetical protein
VQIHENAHCEGQFVIALDRVEHGPARIEQRSLQVAETTTMAFGKHGEIFVPRGRQLDPPAIQGGTVADQASPVDQVFDELQNRVVSAIDSIDLEQVPTRVFATTFCLLPDEVVGQAFRQRVFQSRFAEHAEVIGTDFTGPEPAKDLALHGVALQGPGRKADQLVQIIEDTQDE